MNEYYEYHNISSIPMCSINLLVDIKTWGINKEEVGGKRRFIQVCYLKKAY